MTTRIVDSSGGKKRGGRERAGVFALAGLIVTGVVIYIAINAASGVSDKSRGLLPYQALTATLPESDQHTYRSLRDSLLTAEGIRNRTSRWPDAGELGLPGTDYRWTRFERGVITDYFGQPRDPAQPAWLIEIQEPEPGTAPDPAPNDEQHHRLGDGTTLHVYVWMHRLGGQVPAEFTPQPPNTGWTEVFTRVPNPSYALRR